MRYHQNRIGLTLSICNSIDKGNKEYDISNYCLDPIKHAVYICISSQTYMQNGNTSYMILEKSYCTFMDKINIVWDFRLNAIFVLMFILSVFKYVPDKNIAFRRSQQINLFFLSMLECSVRQINIIAVIQSCSKYVLYYCIYREKTKTLIHREDIKLYGLAASLRSIKKV